MLYPEKPSLETPQADVDHGNVSATPGPDSSSEKTTDAIEAIRSNGPDNNHDNDDEPGHEHLTPRVSRMSLSSLARRVTSVGTTGTSDPNFEVDWEDEKDPENPRNWSLAYKSMCVGFLSWNTWVM